MPLAEDCRDYVDLFFGTRGRFSRCRYCVGLAMCLLLYLAATTEDAFLASEAPRWGFGALAWLGAPLAYGVGAYILFLVATIHVRRCHDLGLHGAFALVILVPVIVILVAMVIGGFRRGTIGVNPYGPDPLVDLREIFEHFGTSTT